MINDYDENDDRSRIIKAFNIEKNDKTYRCDFSQAKTVGGRRYKIEVRDESNGNSDYIVLTNLPQIQGGMRVMACYLSEQIGINVHENGTFFICLHNMNTEQQKEFNDKLNTTRHRSMGTVFPPKPPTPDSPNKRRRQERYAKEPTQKRRKDNSEPIQIFEKKSGDQWYYIQVFEETPKEPSFATPRGEGRIMFLKSYKIEVTNMHIKNDSDYIILNKIQAPANEFCDLIKDNLKINQD